MFLDSADNKIAFLEFSWKPRCRPSTDASFSRANHNTESAREAAIMVNGWCLPTTGNLRMQNW